MLLSGSFIYRYPISSSAFILFDYNASRDSTKSLLYQALDIYSLNLRCISPGLFRRGAQEMLFSPAAPPDSNTGTIPVIADEVGGRGILP